MTSRRATLIFAALLLLAPMAFAAAPVPNGAPVTATVQAAESCNPLLAELRISPLASAKESSTYPACGTCSDLACRGLSIYDLCGGTIRQPKKCKASGQMCLESGAPKCLCVDWVTP